MFRTDLWLQDDNEESILVCFGCDGGVIDCCFVTTLSLGDGGGQPAAEAAPAPAEEVAGLSNVPRTFAQLHARSRLLSIQTCAEFFCSCS